MKKLLAFILKQILVLLFVFSIPNMPTIINIQNADSKAQDIYVLQLQIREATQKLSMSTLGNDSGK